MIPINEVNDGSHRYFLSDFHKHSLDWGFFGHGHGFHVKKLSLHKHGQ